MAINFTNTPGAIFNRWGKLGALIKNMRANQLLQLTAMTDPTTGAVAQYNTESDLQALIGSAYIGTLTGPESVASVAVSLAGSTANRIVYRDNPQQGQTLTNGNVTTSLLEIIRQMKVQGATILAMTITATPTAFTGLGNGVINVSTKRPLDGLVMENSFSENLLLVCNDDSYNGNATAGNEGFALSGPGAQNDYFAFNWPLGSGASAGLNAIDGNTSNGSGNLLTNSGFNTFTVANQADNWVYDVGAAGTAFIQESTIVYDGANSLGIVGNGVTLHEWSQQFNSSSGTVAELPPQTQVSFNGFFRRDGIAPANGTLQVELVDSAGVVINDANGVPNSFTINLTALSTSFASYMGVFRTPLIMPSTYYIQFRCTGTPLTNGRTVYIDKCSLGYMTPAYTSGPSVAIHAGSIPFIAGDYGQIAVSNSRGAAGVLDTFQTLLARMMPQQIIAGGILFPSAAVPTISDNLIQ